MPSEQGATVEVEIAVETREGWLSPQVAREIAEAIGGPKNIKRLTIEIDWSRQMGDPPAIVKVEYYPTDRDGKLILKAIKGD